MKDDYVLLAAKIFHNLFMPMVCLSYEVFFTYEIQHPLFVIYPLCFLGFTNVNQHKSTSNADLHQQKN